ncbi:morphogenetic protein associated with SpoVID [Paenibacillus taihuensis]|uniref:Morphogenetic protein associated with SpoVID n=1 Tax=Paenibacillus taihuensis TaxID=1156355 RepID=A0A3D9R2H8_9BACL|nr:LysM peptidoglycan-binding domain-containing protein [Paenibacillus taihuensis]REE69480.1 morphogenetic protein associated with SpoVID [Paenibacillus taihuensis]
MKIHIVKKGDTLYLIAQKYNVSLEEIIKLNPEITNPDQIDIGMKVKVPTGSNHHNGQMDIMHQHVVQQGDTLWKLSKAWGVPLGDMIKANPQLKNPNVLLTGEIVNIPTPGSSGMMMHEMSENNGKGTGHHHHLSPSSVMQGVQGLMSKIPTGKKPTGQKPSTMPMPIPEVLPEAVEPTPMPIPEPVPTPLPAPMPVVEKKYPVYQAQQHVDLFKQYGVPATEVMSLYDMPKMPEAVSPASQGPMKHGYGFSNPTVVSPEMTGGYGMNMAAVSPAMTGGYGMNMAAVSPASTGGGYGFPTAVSPASTGGSYGFDMGPTAVSPAQEGPEWGPPMTLPWGAPSYGYNPSMVSPAEMGPQGGYGYNPSMVSPAEMGPQGGYGFNPSMVSPAEMGPQGGYGFNPSMVSPAEMGPQGGYGFNPWMVSPAEMGPQGGYGFNPTMVSPAEMGPHGGYGYGFDPSMVSPANVGPQGGYGYGYDPSMVSPANMGPQGYTYMGNGQVSPIVAGANDKNGNCGCREDEEELVDEENIELNAPKAKVARKKKPVIRTVRTTKPKRRGSFPWINQ